MTRPGDTILVADRDLEARTYLETALSSHGFLVQHAEDSEELLDCLRTRDGKSVAAVVLDMLVPGRGGLETWRAIRGMEQRLPVVLLWTPCFSARTVEAGEDRLTCCISKPVAHEELARVLRRFLGSRQPLERDCLREYPTHLNGQAPPENPRMRHIEFAIERVARSHVPVVLQGETGVGKEVLARRIHAYSSRAARPFVKVNCAALPTELVESELFGYERGAFTGANRSQAGLFEVAEGGTLLLDEIGDMAFPLQAKLLQVLQDGEFHRLGNSTSIRVDVRVMAATHSDLLGAVHEGRFREDLFYRLNVISIQVPPLRERKDEIVGLARHFLMKHSPAGLCLELPANLQDAMIHYDWPGNIRELENFIRRFLVFRKASVLADELLQSSRRAAFAPPVSNLQPEATSLFERVSEATRNAEIAAIRSALQATRWSRKHAAELLNLDYKALLYKMKKFQIAAADDRRRKPRAAAAV